MIIQHESGYLNLSDFRAVTFNSDTNITVWWGNGIIGTYSISADEAMMTREMLAWEAKQSAEGIRRTIAEGLFWLDWDRVKARGDMADYEHQRAELRKQGIY